MTDRSLRPASLENYPLIDRSKAKAPSCRLQLTIWVPTRADIAFAIEQLDRHQAPWVLRERLGDHRVAVFVPGDLELDTGPDEA